MKSLAAKIISVENRTMEVRILGMENWFRGIKTEEC
jgi:hypothetical protein